MEKIPEKKDSNLEKFLKLSLKSTRKSYFPQLRKQLEITRGNERRLKLLTDNIPARISFIDSNERFAFVNREYENAFDMPGDRIIGKPVEELLGHDNYQRIESAVKNALSGKKQHIETFYTGKEGEWGWFHIHFIPENDESGQIIGFYDLTIDLTKQKKAEQEKINLEQKLHQARKMEAIGTLAGGISHDFNNLLMGIQGRISLLQKKTDPSSPDFSSFEEMTKLVQKAASLTRQLLGFARGGKYEKQPIQIDKLVNSTVEKFLVSNNDVNIRITHGDSLQPILADPSQMKQVLWNILDNACNASISNEEIGIETGKCFPKDINCQKYGVDTGEYNWISIRDKGIGMDDVTAMKIFDPFFTTREKKRGVGLGLASAYGIVRNHGGFITVSSEKGKGSTFRIFLPVYQGGIQPEADLKSSGIPSGKKTILLVDDEEMIIDVGSAMLEELGYRPLTASSGKEALEIMESEKDRIDLVILDLIMPGLDGFQTFHKIRAMFPQQRILLSSGYAMNGQTEKLLSEGWSSFIQKPYDMSELSLSIRKILSEL